MDFVSRGEPQVFILLGGTAGFGFSGEPLGGYWGNPGVREYMTVYY